MTPVSTVVESPKRTRQPDASDADLDDLHSLVTLSRTLPTDCGERQVFARLDGETRMTLLYGQSFTLEVKPGAHHLRLHNTLVWKNIHFTIEPGEHLDFLIGNEGRWWTWGMVGILGSAPLFLRVERRSRRCDAFRRRPR
jgi:hypothetical protein